MNAIHLVRHGRSAHVHDGRWMSGEGVSDFERAYNAAGIRDDSPPPPELIETASRADVIAASDLTRAIASARRLAPAREPEVTPLLREIEIELPGVISGVRLPIVAWDVMNFAAWSYRLSMGSDHDSMRRADAAAAWLVARAPGNATVLAVTHGGFRRILDARLLARGLRRAPGPSSYDHWSMWSYSG